MRRFLPILAAGFVLIVGGCAKPVGNGLWDLKLGGRARLIAEPGQTEITLTDLAAPPRGRGARGGTQPRIETTKVAAGTTGVVLAVDGDDARFQIADGPKAGTIHWIECKRLEPLGD